MKIVALFFVLAVAGTSFLSGGNNLLNSIGLGVIALILFLMTFVHRSRKKSINEMK